jgi:hypothetical protein
VTFEDVDDAERFGSLLEADGNTEVNGHLPASVTNPHSSPHMSISCGELALSLWSAHLRLQQRASGRSWLPCMSCKMPKLHASGMAVVKLLLATMPSLSLSMSSAQW